MSDLNRQPSALMPSCRVSTAEKTLLNLNDASLVFETLPTAKSFGFPLVANAAAQIIPPAKAPLTNSAHSLIMPGDAIAEELALFNVSNDVMYRKQRRGRVAGLAARTGMLHAPIAANLSQLPLPCNITREILLRPHHPKHTWSIEETRCGAPFAPLVLSPPSSTSHATPCCFY
jgi:hypothetical protein